MYVTDECTLCESCFLICPTGAIYEDPELGRAGILDSACANCGVCMAECPTGAIHKGKPPKEDSDV